MVKPHRKRVLPILPFLIFLIIPVAGHSNDEKVVVRFPAPTEEIFAEFTGPEYDVAAYKPGVFLDIVVTRTSYDSLLLRGFDVRIVETETRLKNNLQIKRKADLPGYRSYQTVLDELHAIVATHPAICRLYDIGDSRGKSYADAGMAAYSDYRHDIWALKVSDNVAMREDEPAVLYAGSHHAREPISVEVTMAVLHHILANYGTDPTITQIVDNTEIWFVPIVNPDGHRIVTQQIDVWWRKNIRDNDGNAVFSTNDGVDLNRNYGFRWGNIGATDVWNSQTYHGPYPWSEPEVVAMRHLVESGHFVAGITYHSYGEDILYPFGYQPHTVTPDNTVIAGLSSEMAANLPSLLGGTYGSMSAWVYYPHMGSATDWMYGVQGAVAVTIELATQFIPPASQIQTICNANIQAAMILLNRVRHTTLTGHVTNAQTGEPVIATIFVTGIDTSGEYRRPYTSDAEFGRYYRFLPEGNHTVTFAAHGYEPLVIESVLMRPGSQSVLDAELVPVTPDPQCLGAPVPAPHIPSQPPDMSPTLTWQPVSGASNYKIRIFDRLPLGAPIMEHLTEGPASFTPRCELPKGDYYWMVSSDLDDSCYSAYSHFALSRELKDALAVLQILAGQDSAQIISDVNDIDGDGKIGIGEAIFVLQSVAGVR